MMMIMMMRRLDGWIACVGKERKKEGGQCALRDSTYARGFLKSCNRHDHMPAIVEETEACRKEKCKEKRKLIQRFWI